MSGEMRVEDFRTKVREWLSGSEIPRQEEGVAGFRASPDAVAEDRLTQRSLWDGGIAGVTVPVEYGGLGLSAAHEAVFFEEMTDYRYPGTMWNSVNIAIPVLLAHGTEQQKLHYIQRVLRAEDQWCQLLSEPSGGSDLAGALTRAVRDGDEWIITGGKIWTSAGNFCNLGVCLARTNPEAPKHAGLTMFILPMDALGVTVQPLTLIGGDADFCQEFFDDVRVPAENVIGEVNNGWSVATTLLVNERTAASRPTRRNSDEAGIVFNRDLLDEARQHGRADDSHVRALIGEAWVLTAVMDLTTKRVSAAIRSGELPGQAAAILKAMVGSAGVRNGEIALEIGGTSSIAWPEDAPSRGGVRRLTSQNIGGGTTEMQLNGVAERLLGLPREPSEDRTLPFNQLRHNTMSAVPKRTTEGGR
jgi:alkylation response protein AidB-like acyl-CoA dehydrogenase